MHGTEIKSLTGRAEVLAATGDHPYPRLTTGGATVSGFTSGGAVLWRCAERAEESISGFGDPAAVARLLADLLAAGALPGVRRVHLPRTDPAVARAAGVPVASGHDDWDFRWTASPPPPVPGEDRVVPLGPEAVPAIEALLAVASPHSYTRPGDTRVRRWYGHWEGNGRDRRLVACGADQSGGGVGSLAGIAVHPEARGRGLGASLTAAMARALHREHGVVSLGVMVDNAPAARLYRLLGFTRVYGRSSVDLDLRAPARLPEVGDAEPPPVTRPPLRRAASGG